MAFLRQHDYRGAQLAYPRQLPAEPRKQSRLQDLTHQHRLFDDRRGERRRAGIYLPRGCRGPSWPYRRYRVQAGEMERASVQLVQYQHVESPAQFLYKHMRQRQFRGLPLCGERIFN